MDRKNTQNTKEKESLLSEVSFLKNELQTNRDKESELWGTNRLLRDQVESTFAKVRVLNEFILVLHTKRQHISKDIAGSPI